MDTDDCHSFRRKHASLAVEARAQNGMHRNHCEARAVPASCGLADAMQHNSPNWFKDRMMWCETYAAKDTTPNAASKHEDLTASTKDDANNEAS